MANKLDDSQIEKRLEGLSGWSREGDTIERECQFDGFNEAVDFINRIAEHADDADHHPEIFNVYNEVELTLTTHDAGGLTEKDFNLAEKINDEL
jgi:4a-hydroxytetrahydrobiopterin dehydratase